MLILKLTITLSIYWSVCATRSRPLLLIAPAIWGSACANIHLCLHAPWKYIQMDLTGRHITEGRRDVYGLVCVCLQTYNTKIYGVESISLALEVFIQEVGPPSFIACDKEGAFHRMARALDK